MAGNDQKDTTVLHVAGGSSGGSAAAVAANLVSMYENISDEIAFDSCPSF